MTPETRYAKSGEVHLAYQVIGDGAVDLVFVPGWITHVELAWEDPLESAFLRRLASFCRLIVFDKRGTGLSDRVPVNQLPIRTSKLDGVGTLIDAVDRSGRAVGGLEGGAMSALFAATYQNARAALVQHGTLRCARARADERGRARERWRRSSATGRTLLHPAVAAPSEAADEGTTASAG